MANCVKRSVAGARVVFSRDPQLPFILDVRIEGGSPPRSNDAVPPVGYAAAVCESRDSAVVEASWIYQHRLTDAALAATRAPFLRCVHAAGVVISLGASLREVRAVFTHTGWWAGLDGRQTEAANTCLARYANFVNSLSL